MRLGTGRAEKAGIPPGDAAGASREVVLGPKGAGKRLPLCSWSRGVTGSHLGCPIAQIAHPPPPQHFAVGRHWFQLGGSLCRRGPHLGGGVQVPWCLCLVDLGVLVSLLP